MPRYAFLAETLLAYGDIAEHLRTLRAVGVPYSDDMIANAKADLEAQVNPDGDTKSLLARYPKAVVASFTGDPKHITEMDALVAYLQMLGTLVNFNDYTAKDLQQ